MMVEIGLLFTSALLAATLIPAQSEAVLASLILKGAHSPLLLVTVATAGNVLGACINWGLGRYVWHFRNRRWFPLSGVQLARTTALYQRFGVWTLLGAWIPFIGDPLTVIAGALKTPLPTFLLLVTLGKAGRYLALVAML
jgi:membrane protein YqaA with SNARE-associated domain